MHRSTKPRIEGLADAQLLFITLPPRLYMMSWILNHFYATSGRSVLRSPDEKKFRELHFEV